MNNMITNTNANTNTFTTQQAFLLLNGFVKSFYTINNSYSGSGRYYLNVNITDCFIPEAISVIDTLLDNIARIEHYKTNPIIDESLLKFEVMFIHLVTTKLKSFELLERFVNLIDNLENVLKSYDQFMAEKLVLDDKMKTFVIYHLEDKVCRIENLIIEIKNAEA